MRYDRELTDNHGYREATKGVALYTILMIAVLGAIILFAGYFAPTKKTEGAEKAPTLHISKFGSIN